MLYTLVFGLIFDSNVIYFGFQLNFHANAAIQFGLWLNFHPNTIHFDFRLNFNPNTIHYGFWLNFPPNAIQFGLWLNNFYSNGIHFQRKFYLVISIE